MPALAAEIRPQLTAGPRATNRRRGLTEVKRNCRLLGNCRGRQDERYNISLIVTCAREYEDLT